MEHIVEQQSDEWYSLRIGSIGASQIADATSKGKGTALSAGRKNAIARLVAERMSGTFADVSANRFKSSAMEMGNEREDQARAAYQFISGNEVRTCGLFTHQTIEGAHASPDGVVVADGQDVGLLEIKCPQPSAHLETLLKQEVPNQYKKQVQFQLACTGHGWCDFVSFNPDFPAGVDLLIIRVERDEDLIAEMEGILGEINAEVTDVIRRLNETYCTDPV